MLYSPAIIRSRLSKTAMADYRIYVLDSHGHFKAAHDVLATGDREAICAARHVEHEYGLEVWQRARRVAVLGAAGEVLDEDCRSASPG